MTGGAGHVLVVDDDRVNRLLLTRSLEREGHRVSSAENGRTALRLLREDPPDAVLLDIVMPELDGVAVLERIKGDSALQHLPVIMISAVDEIDSVVRCIEMGAEDYLPKPFDPVLLRARINAGLAKKRLHELERERVRGVFSRFVPEHVVEDVLARADADLRLGGSRGVGTVMFTDIRGFTTFSESTPPQRVIELLNEYFGEMTDAIFAHGGTLVAYRGDGFLAVFGAPIELHDHADRAVAAAREMLEIRLPRFNRWLRERGLGDGFAMGIGLNSGHFMSGNVGSARRLEYTVSGDTVNTAARLEEMTKSARRPILIAGSTRSSLVSPPGDLTYVGEFNVRGRQSTIRLWTLASAGSPAEAARAQSAPDAHTPGWESVRATERAGASSVGA
ncbi:MAG: response regulator [Thermoleophilaceae bacterium]|nr:response regulator [Thermoleophilaceae bacterium]